MLSLSFHSCVGICNILLFFITSHFYFCIYFAYLFCYLFACCVIPLLYLFFNIIFAQFVFNDVRRRLNAHTQACTHVHTQTRSFAWATCGCQCVGVTIMAVTFIFMRSPTCPPPVPLVVFYLARQQLEIFLLFFAVFCLFLAMSCTVICRQPTHAHNTYVHICIHTCKAHSNGVHKYFLSAFKLRGPLTWYCGYARLLNIPVCVYVFNVFMHATKFL